MPTYAERRYPYWLMILKDFADTCEYNNTAILLWRHQIGALRHKGFIPWDDDIDVCLPAEDQQTLDIYDKEWPKSIRS